MSVNQAAVKPVITEIKKAPAALFLFVRELIHQLRL
jgi:hypothetical protein